MRISRIEEALENALDGAFGRVMGGKLHPLEISRVLWREIESGRLTSSGVVYVPNRLTARVNPDDLAALRAIEGRLAGEIAASLETEARENGWNCGARITVMFVADPAVRPGQVEAAGTLDESPLPASLTVEGGPQSGQVFLLAPGATLGRSADCRVVLADVAVSRHHCRFDWLFEGYRITDLGSSNGTFVNDVQVMEYTLGEGDAISVGTTRLRLRYSVAPPHDG